MVRCFEEAARSVADATGAGLLLIVDEAGKALEYAAQEPRRGDVYLLQALAEAAARSADAPIVIMTVLHQPFDHYAHQLSAAEGNEWAKVQGRFGDLAFREGGDQLIRLTAEAITHTGKPPAQRDWKRLVRSTARWMSEGTGWNERELKRSLDACWPLHPITAALLGPLFRGRLAQNERSLFAFLSSGEPFSFRDFLRTHGVADLYAESVFVYRQFRDSYRIWEGSDLDLDALIAEAVQRLPADTSVAAVLQRSAPRAPLVARRHLYETGAFRCFDVRFVDAERLFLHSKAAVTASSCWRCREPSRRRWICRRGAML